MRRCLVVGTGGTSSLEAGLPRMKPLIFRFVPFSFDGLTLVEMARIGDRDFVGLSASSRGAAGRGLLRLLMGECFLTHALRGLVVEVSIFRK